jgi:ubiquitin-activating enzyme E1
LALPLFVFSEPQPPNKTKSKEYDPIMAGPVKAIPEGFTIYDKIIVDGPITLQKFIDQMKERFNIEVTLVSAGKMSIYNAYLPGKKHEPRKSINIEDIYKQIAVDEPIPEGRYYLQLEIGGEVIGEGCDFSIPTIKYIFAKP